MTITPVNVPSLPSENAGTLDPSFSWLIYNPVGTNIKLRRMLHSELLTYLTGIFLRYDDLQAIANGVFATKADQTTTVKQLVASGALSITHTDSSVTFTVTPGAVSNATASVPGAVLLNSNGEIPPIVYRKAEVDTLDAGLQANINAVVTVNNTQNTRLDNLEAINAGSRLTSLETYQGTSNARITSLEDIRSRALGGRWTSMTTVVGGTDSLITGTGGNENPTFTRALGSAGSVGQNTIITVNAPSSGSIAIRVQYKGQFNYTLGTTRPSRVELKLARQVNGAGYNSVDTAVWLSSSTDYTAATFVGFRDELIEAGNTYNFRLLCTNTGSGGTMDAFNLAISVDFLRFS